MSHRSALKWLHWLCFGLFAYFLFVEPAENLADRGAALAAHAGVGEVTALLMGVWLVLYLRRGLVGRSGPKLPQWGKRAHPIGHHLLFWAIMLSVLTGLISGLLAPFPIRGFGLIPMNIGTGPKELFEFVGNVHGQIFNVTVVLVLFHIVFHLWRHLRLRDNALKIMAPRVLHRFL